MNNIKKFIFTLIFILFFIFFSLPIIKKITDYYDDLNKEKDRIILIEQEAKIKLYEEERIKKLDEYNYCLNETFNEYMKNNELISLEEEINDYAINNNISYRYYNIKDGYTLAYNENKSYISASVIKLLPLIYLIEESNQGNVDLDETNIRYIKRHSRGSSDCVKAFKLNTKISLRDLLNCSIKYSDNSAQLMLYEYAGSNKLNYLANKLGLKNRVYAPDYGYLNVHDSFIMMNEINELIKLNNSNSKFLINILDNDYYNCLNTDNIYYYHKYGMYKTVYHDTGILKGDNPYILILMSNLRYNQYCEKFQLLSKKINDLNQLKLAAQERYCQSTIYGGDSTWMKN